MQSVCRWVYGTRFRVELTRQEPRVYPLNGQRLGGLETLKLLADSRNSYSRFGDGELRLAFSQGHTVNERWSAGGARALRKVLAETHPSVLLGFNNTFALDTSWRLVNKYLPTPKDGRLLSIVSMEDVIELDRRKQTDELRRYQALLTRLGSRQWGEASCFNLGIYVREYAGGDLDEVRSLIREVLIAESPLVFCNPNSRAGQGLITMTRNYSKRGRIRIIQGPVADGLTDFASWHERLAVSVHGHDLILLQSGALATYLAWSLTRELNIRCLDVGNISLRAD